MNRVIKLLCVFLLNISTAMTDSRVLHDKIAVVVNSHIITEGQIDQSAEVYVKLSEKQDLLHDPQFRLYVSSLLVTQHLLEDFAGHNNLLLTPEEEERALTFLMEGQGRSYSEFSDYAVELGVDVGLLKKIYLGDVLQQKVGRAVIAPLLEVTEDQIAHEKHQYIYDNALYKIKSWTIDLDAGETIDSIKTIKKEWAESNEVPTIGDVHDIGWKSRSELPDLFLKTIEGVAPGNLLGPIQSAYGYHLIWFEGEKIPEMPDDDQIRERILQQQYYEKFSEWIADLHQYNIVIYK